MTKPSVSLVGGVVCFLVLVVMGRSVLSSEDATNGAAAVVAPSTGVHFSGVERTEEGAVLLRVGGRAGQSYVLQRSQDLRAWAPVVTNVLGENHASVLDSELSGQDMVFYRLLILDSSIDLSSENSSRRFGALRRMSVTPPTISITSPTNTASFDSPSSLVIEADASDDGTVTKVEFFADLTKLGEDTASPWSYTWSDPSEGAYVLRAKATDDDELSTTSSPVDVSVYSDGQGGENLALGQTAAQSSTGYGGVASRAVDGNTSGDWSNASVTHTSYDYQAWWEVDLGAIGDIDSIDLWNRTDCCSSRLSNFYVLVSDNAFSSTSLGTVTNQTGVSSYYTSGTAGTLTSISIGRSGRYVRVQLTGTDYLSLAEVEVWAAGPPYPPSDPSNLVAEALTSTQTRLAWELDSSNETAVKVERKVGAEGGYELVAVLSEGSQMWWDDGATQGSTNIYRVRVSSPGGHSGYSNEAATYVPTGVVAIPLTNVEMWLRALSLRGLTNEEPVASWADISGSGNDATQANGTYQPLWIEGTTNSSAVVRFDGTNDLFDLPNFLDGTTEAEVFVVLKAESDAPSTARSLWKIGTYSSSSRFYPNTDGTILDDFGSTTAHGVGDPAQPLDELHIYGVSSRSGEWTARINGAVQHTTTANTYDYNYWAPKLGYSYGYFAGDIAEVLVYDRVLSEEERGAVNVYLNSHHGIVTSDPATPTSLTATALSPTQISVAWEASLSGVATSFSVERKSGAGGAYAEVASLLDATSYIDTGLAASTLYYYRVTASNFAGASSASSEASATTWADSQNLPLGELKLWLKADAGVIRQGSGNTVLAWWDQSGVQSGASQGTAAYQPTWVDGQINDRPVVRFDSTNDLLSLPNFLGGAAEAEAFVVLKADADLPAQDYRGLWRVGTSSSGAGGYPRSSGSIIDDFGSTSWHIVGDPAQPLNQYHIYNIASLFTGWNARINGVFQYSTAVNTPSFMTTPWLGADGGYFDGDVAEILVFDRGLTIEERDGVGGYLSAKYELVSSAPSAPTNLLTTAVAPGQLQLTWTRVSTDESSFRVERKLGTGGAYELLAVVAGGTTNYLDTAADPGAPSFYRVKAHNYFGQSGYSDEISPPLATITLPAPPAASMPGGTNSITATASDSDGSVSEVKFYVQETLISTDSSSPYETAWVAGDIGVVAVTAKAIDDQGNSSFSRAVLIRVYPDSDQDGLADDEEALLGTDPTEADTDGDSVSDAQDAYPLDPTRSAVPSSDPMDTTGPSITLQEPVNATLLP